MNAIARQPQTEIEAPRAVKLDFIRDDDRPSGRLVQALSLESGEVCAVLGFHAMAKWLDARSYSYIYGTNGVWARLQ